ncbi:hypothetical protein [Scleromatobacter humisilvae]|uniref:Uncharacterized protein n=1 Tax=Scleromatobacter humisilvae TaxID=2897159 RepID=A0A9X2C376_9BURK|nr:hypothetical protein [Scleromatobacter humisilvae]MCK9687709.1 hypothetical protein [Scleromatobacter humisilvae]
MPILDIHTRVAACLHIVLAVLGLLFLLAMAALVGAFGALGPNYGIDRQIADWVGGVGILLIALFALLPVLEIIGAVLLLRGNDTGRIFTIVFSVLSLVNIPIGTAVGAYSLWALLRAKPPLPPATQAAPMPAGMQQPF